ncbi:acyl-CoA thioesterase [bacterium]|jgi:acyl-CoA thioester hydrolase|nr:acyl-CoA thioesterase [bacterium]
MQQPQGKPTQYCHKIYFAETDQAGVVHHSNYINYLEAGRIEYLNTIGYPYHAMQADKVGLAPVDIQIQYKSPLRLEDQYIVTTAPIKFTHASLTMKQTVTKQDGTLCTEAIIKLACLDESVFKPIHLPNELLEKVHEFEEDNLK